MDVEQFDEAARTAWETSRPAQGPMYAQLDGHVKLALAEAAQIGYALGKEARRA